MADESKKTVFRRIVVPDEEKKKYLVGNTPPFLGKPFELSREDFTIGREEGRSLQIPSDMVSRLHATIGFKDGNYYLVDNDSSNGTFLNNNQVAAATPIQLNHKDVVKVDTYEFIFIDSARADLWETLKPLNRTGAQIVTFYSPKGGTGLTSVVCNLAHAMATSTKKKVAVADFNLRFGDVLTYMAGKPGLGIHELIQDPNITGETIGKFLRQGPSFNYLTAPVKTEYAELVKADHVKKILWSLEANHDFVIVDLKNEIDDVSLTTWEISNLIYLVAQPEIGQMLALKKILDIMGQLKYPESKVKVLINRLGRPGTLSAEEVKAIIKRDFVSLPFAPEDAVLTSHGGQLYVKERPSSALSQAVMNIQRTICGEETVAAVEGGIFGKLRSILGF
ncbi:MAG TPA: FHA domain-containing protein [Candidatus Ozemobacteraceae bacterium]|nr:FHA domain-containing protein [Candidatus Ozemobacteraceae bacterium]